MAKTKKKQVNNVVCVRISDNDMECIREMMRITHMSASSVMREAFKTLLLKKAA